MHPKEILYTEQAFV